MNGHVVWFGIQRGTARVRGNPGCLRAEDQVDKGALSSALVTKDDDVRAMLKLRLSLNHSLRIIISVLAGCTNAHQLTSGTLSSSWTERAGIQPRELHDEIWGEDDSSVLAIGVHKRSEVLSNPFISNCSHNETP